MSSDGFDWVLYFWHQFGGCDDKDDDELTDAEDDYAQDAGNDLIYSPAVEDQYYEAAEAPSPVVEEGTAAAEDEGGREPVALERDGGEEGVLEAGAEEADDEETESEYGDPIENEIERQADEGDGEEDETEYSDAVEGDDDDDSSADEDDEETDTDFSNASDEDMEERESDEEGQGGESSSHHGAAEGVESEKIDLENPDEVGRYMGDDLKLSWDSVDDSEQHLHGPRVTGWRIIRYLEYLFNETPAQAKALKGDAPVVAGREPKPSTPKMIKARMNAIGCLGKCESALYDYPLSQMQDKVAQGRAFMRVKLVNLNEEQIRTGADQHRGSLDDCYNVDQYKELHHNIIPEKTFKIYARSKDFPSQALWRVLAVKVMIQLAHQNAIYRIEGEHETAKLLAENHCLRKQNGQKDVLTAELQAENRALKSDKKSLLEQLAQLKAELAALTVSSAGNVGADNSAAGAAGSSKMEKGGAGPSTPEPAAPTPEIVYFDSVVRPWRDSTTVADAWALWNKASFLVEGRTLRAVAEDPRFIVKWAHFKRGEECEDEKGKFKPTVRLDAKDGTCEKQLRRIHKAMLAVEKFRVDDSVEAMTNDVNVLFQTSPSVFADGLIVKEKRGTKRQRTSTVGGKSLTDDAQERVSYLLVLNGLRDDTWGEELFGKAQWMTIKDVESQKPLKKRPGA
ncbi:unnamed protein product [Closterium sp. Naga37s-1]|nr:unnamed protein product [Closterium sp. Naga37s-1]